MISPQIQGFSNRYLTYPTVGYGSVSTKVSSLGPMLATTGSQPASGVSKTLEKYEYHFEGASIVRNLRQKVLALYDYMARAHFVTASDETIATWSNFQSEDFQW